jgi:hypothetical protein
MTAPSLGAYATNPLGRIGIDPTVTRFADYDPLDAQIVADFFTAPKFREVSDVPARIITSIAMFYDIEDPVAFARDIRDGLAPDGLWHFEQSYMPSMLRSAAYDTVCHEHIEYYSLATVRRILDEARLELIDVRFNRVNGGSFAVTAAHRGARFTPSRVLIDWFVAQEERIRLDTPGPYRRFEESVFQHRTDLTQLVKTIRSSGASVMGYGASTKGNVLLQFCGFGPTQVEAARSETAGCNADPEVLSRRPWYTARRTSPSPTCSGTGTRVPATSGTRRSPWDPASTSTRSRRASTS